MKLYTHEILQWHRIRLEECNEWEKKLFLFPMATVAMENILIWNGKHYESFF